MVLDLIMSDVYQYMSLHIFWRLNKGNQYVASDMMHFKLHFTLNWCILSSSQLPRNILRYACVLHNVYSKIKCFAIFLINLKNWTPLCALDLLWWSYSCHENLRKAKLLRVWSLWRLWNSQRERVLWQGLWLSGLYKCFEWWIVAI